MKTTNVKLKFPSQFSGYINNVKTIDFEGESMTDFIQHLDHSYGDISQRLFDEEGNLKPYLNFFIEDKNIKDLEGLDSKLTNGNKISLLLSRAGG